MFEDLILRSPNYNQVYDLGSTLKYTISPNCELKLEHTRPGWPWHLINTNQIDFDGTNTNIIYLTTPKLIYYHIIINNHTHHHATSVHAELTYTLTIQEGPQAHVRSSNEPTSTVLVVLPTRKSGEFRALGSHARMRHPDLYTPPSVPPTRLDGSRSQMSDGSCSESAQ